MQDIPITEMDPEKFESLLDPERYRRFSETLEKSRDALRDRTIWHVNSTEQGGGVAEMLAFLLGYQAGAGIDVRWVVIEGNEDFFEVTKRIHHHLHGEAGDEGNLGPKERAIYDRALAPNAPRLSESLKRGDIVIVHDPQTVGLTDAIRSAGAHAVWICHIGADIPNDLARGAWDFLRSDVEQADAVVFSRKEYAWEGLDPSQVHVIPPCIDAFSPKNQELDSDTVDAILLAGGIIPTNSTAQPTFRRADGSEAHVANGAEITQEESPPADAPIVLQVSRWDPLKDHEGMLRAFADHMPNRDGAHLLLVGPQLGEVSDDPEDEGVLEELRAAWRELPRETRSAIHVVCLPMTDQEENSAMVNALQRKADVAVQKSLAEGFGLTVAEAMWKGCGMVASRVGGIQDQIEHEESGLLVDDPEDLPSFASAITTLLDDPDLASRLGAEARERVRTHYLAPRCLEQQLNLVTGLLNGHGDRGARA
jgi:trehalose synthase